MHNTGMWVNKYAINMNTHREYRIHNHFISTLCLERAIRWSKHTSMLRQQGIHSMSLLSPSQKCCYPCVVNQAFATLDNGIQKLFYLQSLILRLLRLKMFETKDFTGSLVCNQSRIRLFQAVLVSDF